MIYTLFDTECNGEQILEKEVYLKMCCYWFSWGKLKAYTSIPQIIVWRCVGVFKLTNDNFCKTLSEQTLNVYASTQN